MRALQQEDARLASSLETIDSLAKRVRDAADLTSLAAAENDETMLAEIAAEAEALAADIETTSLAALFTGDHDARDCFLTVQAGSGGTEAQDWAAMLLRMYMRYCDAEGMAAEALDETAGEVAGIKSATVKIRGENAYGLLRVETGVHRLVRKSPFDSNRRRHTSFASVFVYPVVDDNIEVKINPQDLRVDTFRASGAGGQHVNTTDSAVRITHLPTGIVVQCQSDRSQHKNKAAALAVLRARLFQHEQRKKDEERRRLEADKEEISWGRQIRSYVLDQARIKDLRTGHESGDTRAVLDGALRPFIDAALRATAKR